MGDRVRISILLLVLQAHGSHSVGEVDTDAFDFTIPDGYGHGEANEFLGQEDNMDEDNQGV